MSNPTTTAAVRRAGQILKSRDGLVAATWGMAKAGRHEDALVSTHDLALLASDVLHLLDGIHTRAAEKHRRAALELLDEASAIRDAVELAQAEQAQEPGVEAHDDVAAGVTSVAWANADASSLGTFADGRAALVQKLSGGAWTWTLFALDGEDAQTGRAASRGAAKEAVEQARDEAASVTPEQEATPEALERVHVSPDGQVLALLQPEGLYRAATSRVDELRDEYAGVTTETMRSEWHLSLRHLYGATMPSHIARASRLEMLVCYGHGSVPEPAPAPEDPSAVPVAPEASEGVGRPAPVDHVLQARVGAEWQDCITGPDEAMVRELLARFDATYPGREHRVISRPRATDYLVELVEAQDEVEARTGEWIEGAHRHYVGDGSMEPYRAEIAGYEIVLTADLDAEQWHVEVTSEHGVARLTAATLGDVRTWIYDLVLDEPGERDEDPEEDEGEATYEVQGLYGAKWETETHASTAEEADSLLADYRRCAPGRPYRVLVRYPLPDGPWI